MVPELYSELYAEIVSHTSDDSDALLALCLASKHFLPHARQALYKDISIATLYWFSIPLTSLRFTSIKTFRIFNTFTEHNPTLAELVHSFLFLPSSMKVPKGKRNITIRALGKSLPLMINLKHLYLDIPYLESHPARTRVFELDEGLRQISIQLRSFHTFVFTLESTKNVYGFLNKQTNLESLWIPKFPSGWSPEKHSRNIRVLGGDKDVLERILPYRSITHLTWLRAVRRDETLSLTPPLIEALKKVRTFGVHDLTAEKITQVFQCMENVRVLHLFSVFNTHPNRWCGLYDPVAEDLESLQNLQVLIQSDAFKYDWEKKEWEWNEEIGDYPLDDIERISKNREAKVKSWFEKLPKLQLHYFQVANCKRFDGNYLKWRRGVDGVIDRPELVGTKEVLEHIAIRLDSRSCGSSVAWGDT